MSAHHDDTTPGTCYHVIAWSGTHARAAIERCFTSRNTANSAIRRGLIGDRSEHHLYTRDGRDYSVAPCRPGCRCGTWKTGHNREILAQRPEREFYACQDCGALRRVVHMVVDPSTEEPRIYCWRCRLLVVNRLVSRRRPPMPPRKLRPFQRDGDRDREALDIAGFKPVWK